MQENKVKLSQTQLNQVFAEMTRQNMQKLPTETGVLENDNIRFELPPVNYTASIKLLVELAFTVTHASATTWTAARFAPYNFISRINVDSNNGFIPYSVSGVGAYLMQMLKPNSIYLNDIATSATARGSNHLTGVASSGGSANTARFMIELPLEQNKRDPIGYIMTQDPVSRVNVSIDTGAITDLFSSTTGYTIAFTSCNIYPWVDSYTHPNNPFDKDNPNRPLIDLSQIKLVQEQIQTINATGDFDVKIPTGTTFRKIILDFYDGANGQGAFTDTEITKFEIIINQASKPYQLTARELIAVNESQYNKALPLGVYAFDFTDQGLPNYGGTRDYINTKGIPYFYIRVTTSNTGSVRVVSESWATLKANAM